MQITLNDQENNKLLEEIKHVVQQAYLQGVEDGKEAQAIPHHMKKEDLAKFFNVSEATVENIIRMDGFPKSKVVRARYPRDLVIRWANENVDNVYLHRSRPRAI